MKAEIHPQFYSDAKVTCACGNTFTTGSTQQEISIEICSACHPFYTGEERVVDTAGRVEKFKARQAQAQQAKPRGNKKKETKKQDDAKE